jgi:chromatin remodeling complex protein RSC6
MPRKNSSTTTKSEKPVVEKADKSKKSKKDVVVEVPKEELIEEDISDVEAAAVDAIVDSSAVDGADIEGSDSKNTSESVVDSFDEIIKLIDDEIETLRTSQSKSTGVKFLRSLNKRLKTLKSKTTKAIKQRKTTRKPTTNTNSGFLKPVQISKEMAKFTGWDPALSRSRVDVTKHICKYIKDNDLQNPKDRREILADDKLKKLLAYDPKKDDKPLTYYKIQSYLKPHFTALPKAVEA